jgi:hypothetical protein
VGKNHKAQNAYGLKRILSWFDSEWKLRKRLKKTTIKPDEVIVSSLSLLSILNRKWLKRNMRASSYFEVTAIWPLVLTCIGSISEFNPFYIFLVRIEKKRVSKIGCN